MTKTIGLFILACLAIAAIPATRDEAHWLWADYQGATASYKSYLSAWPDGRHGAEALERHDELSWADAKAANTVSGFEQYLFVHNAGKYVTQARENIESLHWLAASKANTIKSYRDYAMAHPQGQFANQAGARLFSLRTDNTPFETAWKTGTEDSFKRFLDDYPGHRRTAQVRQALVDLIEGRDIFDLLQEKKIEVEAKGSGIERVFVRMRKLVPYPLTVRIPVGTFFVSANPAAQNMVTTAESKVTLDSDQWRSVYPAAACANRPRDIPGGEDHFTVMRSPQQAELTRLMPTLDAAKVDTETRQAAVWIITDNASYSDLGVLIASQFGFGGSRVINELETARAMQICDEAGIDLTKKAVWKDRQRIISGLEDPDLKAWLEQR